MHLQRTLEVNKLPDVEIKIITKNGILRDLTIREKNSHPIQSSSYRTYTKTNAQGTKKTVSRQSFFMVKSRNMGK